MRRRALQRRRRPRSSSRVLPGRIVAAPGLCVYVRRDHGLAGERFQAALEVPADLEPVAPSAAPGDAEPHRPASVDPAADHDVGLPGEEYPTLAGLTSPGRRRSKDPSRPAAAGSCGRTLASRGANQPRRASSPAKRCGPRVARPPSASHFAGTAYPAPARPGRHFLIQVPCQRRFEAGEFLMICRSRVRGPHAACRRRPPNALSPGCQFSNDGGRQMTTHYLGGNTHSCRLVVASREASP
jgi:hypothetical protein